MNKLVSIIIPIYNGENTIKKCIDSIVRQTYKNVEIILVNDGSSDNTDNIIKALLAGYSNMKYICKKNSGVSVSRNIGIDSASGEYIVFLDSDDTIEVQFIEKLYEQCGERILPMCGMNITYPDGRNEKRIYDNNEAVSSVRIKDIAHLYRKYLLSSCVNKMYSKKVICENNICFPADVSNGEDLLFNLQYVEHMKEFKIVNDAMYNYNISSDGTLHMVYGKERFYFISSMYKAFIKLLEKLDSGSDSFDIVKKLIMEEYVFAIQLYLRNSNDNFADKADNLRKIFKSSEYNSASPYLKDVCGGRIMYYLIKLKSPTVLIGYYYLRKCKSNRS